MGQKMSETEARTFGYFSAQNAAIAEAACANGSCKAYESIFTFRRWIAQGRVVSKGQHGTKIVTQVPVVKKNETTGLDEIVGTRPKTAVVFCRCQTVEIQKAVA